MEIENNYDERKLIQLNNLVGVVHCDQEYHIETT